MRMMPRSGPVLAVAMMATGYCLAQGPGSGGEIEPGHELRQAMQRYFETRLRTEVMLTDEQMGEIVPLVQQIEASRVEATKERREAERSLRRALREGADDAELSAQLDRMDRAELEWRRLELDRRAELEEKLTARQRVQFRFFVDRFRRDMQRRVQRLRQERGTQREGRRRGPPRQRP